ncbi:hypothetical protein [Pseudarthrobacter chlorophenolicus]|nr:hypothetical protein [Pseudarthrobacter chlorophenolicus]SDQ94131.1 hypothetical protein SAMN04489738_3722 [Pseudarthrobacter chlorophenolicus]
MFLLTSLNLLLDGRRNEAGGSRNTESGTFPAGRLTSAAWAGWWHEDAA